MAGKTIMYCHGFASSGQTGTAQYLRQMMPQARVIAPDIPIHPEEAMSLLQELCDKEQPDLIIGTSMGGMYAEQLHGFDRICVNPALEMGETMKAHGMTGTQQFQNPRQDGMKEFYVDKALIKEYRERSEQRFRLSADPVQRDKELQQVWGLFGDRDDVVNTYDMFREVYPQALHFHGEHRLNDKVMLHSVIPVIRWIDDKQEGHERPIIYISMETAHGTAPGKDGRLQPLPSFQKAVELLTAHYQVFFVATDPSSDSWLEEYVNVPAWHHAVYTYRPDLLYGDFLISRQKVGDPMATFLEYGSDTFKTWDDLIVFFERLKETT